MVRRTLRYGVTRARYVPVLLAPCVVLALGACASLRNGPPADTEAIAERVAFVGIAPELVRITEVDGFDLVTQAVGVYGDDGMSAVWSRVDADGVDLVTLTTSRPSDPPLGEPVAACADLSDPGAPGTACEVEHEDAVVRLTGEGVDAGTLRAAAESVRVPRVRDLDRVFADVPRDPGVPVERGDLPEGDRAPDDEPGVGG